MFIGYFYLLVFGVDAIGAFCPHWIQVVHNCIKFNPFALHDGVSKPSFLGGFFKCQL